MSQNLLKVFRNSLNCEDDSRDMAVRSSSVVVILSGFWIEGKIVFKMLPGLSYAEIK